MARRRKAYWANAGQLNFLFHPSPEPDIPVKPPPGYLKPDADSPPDITPSVGIPVSDEEDAKALHSLRESDLSSLVGRPVKIIYTSNRSRLISYRDDPGGVRRLRVSWVLKEAPGEVWRELGLWTMDPRAIRIFTQSTHSGDYIHQPEIRKLLEIKRPAPRKLVCVGEVHDLKEIFQEINKNYFSAACDAKVGWMRVPNRTGSRGIHLGSYSFSENLILIHPVLDWRKAPRYVVAGTLFHEMVHWVLREEAHPGNRQKPHGRRFYEIMARWPQHERYERWVKDNTPRLIRERNRIVRRKRFLKGG